MQLKKRIFLFVSLGYILYTVVPIIPDVTGIEVSFVNLLTFITLFVIYPRAFANRMFYWFLTYAAILAVYVMVGKPLTIGIGTVHDSKKVIIEYAFMLPSLSIISILTYLKEYKLIKIVSFGGLFFLLASFAYLIPMILSEGEALRIAHNLQAQVGYRMLGMPNYTLQHAYIIAVPALMYGFKIFQARKKWFVLTVIFLFVFIIIHTFVTTSLLITFTVIVFSLLYNTNQKIKSFIILFILGFIVIVLHSTGVFIQMFDFLIRFFDGTAVQPKMEGFKYIYLFGDVENAGGHITGRLGFHEMSWKAFSENFLIGGTSPVGGHSNIIDRLGGMGLIPFVPFIMIIATYINALIKLLNTKQQRISFFLGIISVFTLLYQKGLFGQEGWLFFMVLLPGLIISFYSIRENQSIRKISAPDSSFQPSSGFADF